MKEAAFHGQQRFTDAGGHKGNAYFQRSFLYNVSVPKEGA